MAVTQLTYNGATTDAAPTTTAKFLRDIGNFTKVQSGTKILVTWDSHGLGTAAGLGICNLSLRVDNSPAFANDLGAVFKADGAYHPLTNTRVFTGLGAGVHTVSIYSRGVAATSCADNDGNYTKSAVIQEIN